MNRQEIVNAEFNEYLKDILSKAATQFDIKHSGRRVANNLAKFELFKHQQNPRLVDSWIVQQAASQFTLCCVEIDSTLVLPGKYSSLVRTQTHKFFYGHLESKKDFPKSYVRPETIPDKLAEIFQSVEIDFPEHKEFSKKYFCVSSDPLKFRNSCSLPLLDALSAAFPVETEFSNRECLMKQTKSIIDSESSLAFIYNGIKLARVLNH